MYLTIHKPKELWQKNSVAKDMNSLREQNLQEGIPPDSFLKSQMGLKNTLHCLLSNLWTPFLVNKKQETNGVDSCKSVST